MGLFSSKKPSLELPAPPKYKTAQDLFNSAIGFAKQNSPLAYGAREGALSDLNRGTAYYESFQPTSFEQALGNQYFSNVMPDVERSIKQNLSLSGIESSPILAEQIGKARGNLGVDIGQILANLANERAKYSLSSRLGIDPYNTYGNFLETDMSQDNLQKSTDYQYSLQRAMLDYQNNLANAKSKSAGIGTLGTLIGAGAGMALAPFTGGLSIPAGAALGASLGGTGASLFGGDMGGGGINFGDALSIAQMFPSSGKKSTTSSADPGYFREAQKELSLGSAQPVNSGGMDIGSLLSKFNGMNSGFSLFS
jgi:hypothetical protein